MEGRHKADKQPHGSVGENQGSPKYQKKDTYVLVNIQKQEMEKRKRKSCAILTQLPEREEGPAEPLGGFTRGGEGDAVRLGSTARKLTL